MWKVTESKKKNIEVTNIEREKERSANRGK